MADSDEPLDRAPCGFLSFADDGSILRVNSRLLDMLGYERDALLGGHIERLMGVGSRIFYQTHLFPLIRMHGYAEEIFLKLRTAAGEDVGVLVNAQRREAGDAAVTDCVVVRVRQREKFEAELLRARREAERAMAERAEQARALEAANALLEAQKEELESQKEELEAANETLEAQALELELQQEESERLRDEAEAASRAKSDFLAVMSHELRTPLNAIAGYVQLLELGVHGTVTDAQLEALDRIDRSQRRLLRLINDVLNLSRLESGHVEYDAVAVSVGSTIDEVLPIIEPQAAAKRLALEVDVPREAEVRADASKLEQILINLLSNAIKFTPESGAIRISGAATPEAVSLSVADTGIGIAPEKLTGIFDPFVQVDAGTTRSGEGTGLGLAISRDLARGMGGDLEVESAVGRGSTFTLTLPRAAAAAEAG